MLHFCHQIRYTNAAWNRVLQNPEDRFEVVRSTIESLGGKMDAAFFTMDSYDVLAITEFPDDVSAAAIAIAFSVGGEVAHIHSTKLLDASEALEAMHKARPASSTSVSHSRSPVVSVS